MNGCFRRVVMLFLPMVLAACHGGQQTRPMCDLVTLSKVEAVLNDPKGFAGDFIQTWPNGGQSQGHLFYMPGKLRLTYDTPVKMVVVARNKRMVAKKFDDQSITHIGLARNPLGLMLDQPVKLVKPIMVTAIQHNVNMLQISLASSDNPSQGLLTLRFRDMNGQLVLNQLQGVDARKHRTIIDVDHVHVDSAINESYFTYPDQD